jgi:hypothetical protein
MYQDDVLVRGEDGGFYNWKTRQTAVNKVRIKVNGLMVRGSRIEYSKDAEGKDFITVYDAYVTTEDVQVPSTWIGTGTLTIYPGDYGKVSRLSIAAGDTDITVPVLGNRNPRALTAIEVVTGAEFYDEHVKYEPAELHHVIPARLAPQTYAKAQELAVRAHVALGCRGCSRSDFMVDAEGTPVILETNTIPGMTAASLLPDSARHEGIAFPELCRLFVELALTD